MTIELYQMIEKFREYYYNYKDFSGEITKDDICDIYNDNNFEISTDDRRAIEGLLNSDNFDQAFQDYIIEEYSQMSPENVTNNVLEFINFRIFDSRIISSVKDINSLLDNIDKIPIEEHKFGLISLMKMDDIAKYLNENGRQKKVILKLCVKINPKGVIKLISKLDNSYYRSLLVKQASEYDFKIEELINCIDKYDAIRRQLEGLNSEEEKAKFIATVNDYDMRLNLLSQIKSRENRDIIISSFQAQIDSRLKSQVDLVQTMIREYFEDISDEGLAEDEKEQLEIVFRNTNVTFENLESSVNGRANYIFDFIQISNRHKYNINRTLGFLIHEYHHILAHFDYKTNRTELPKNIDEGMADTFADLVVNHYLQKHGKIVMDGKVIRIEFPYQVYSGYHFENALARTMLYGLSKSGNDKKAVIEYTLGDKRKFCELVFGQENTSQRDSNQFGTPNLDTDIKELYDSPQLDFSDIDFSSIYAKRNFILPLYELQNRLNSKQIDVVGITRTGRAYFANYIGEQYFDGRRLYQISREEMQEFKDLLIKQRNPSGGEKNIIDYDEFYNNKTEELSSEEIQKYSFEILDTSLAMWSDLSRVGRNLESVWGQAFMQETQKVHNGQNITESLHKYKRIIPDYLKLIDPSKGDEEAFVYDFINDLKFSYLQQIRENIEKGNIKDVIDALKGKDGNIYLDSDIKEILRNYGILIADGEKSGLDDCIAGGIRIQSQRDAITVIRDAMQEDKTEDKNWVMD